MKCRKKIFSFFKKLKTFLFIHLSVSILAAAHCVMWDLLLQRVDSLVMAHRLSSCGAWAYLLHDIWDLSFPAIKPMSPALAGGFLATGPPGKSPLERIPEQGATVQEATVPWREIPDSLSIERTTTERRKAGEETRMGHSGQKSKFKSRVHCLLPVTLGKLLKRLKLCFPKCNGNTGQLLPGLVF